MASAAVETFPTESVVLISMSCLKMSRESCRVVSSTCAWSDTANNNTAIAQEPDAPSFKNQLDWNICPTLHESRKRLPNW